MDEAVLYVVRVWSARKPFRASVRPVQAEQSLLFTDPQALLAYLCGRAARQPAPPSARNDSRPTA